MKRTGTSDIRHGSTKRRSKITATVALAGVSLLSFVGIQVASSQVASAAATQTTIGSGFNGPYGVAVDSSGYIFVADTFNSQIVKMNADGTNQTNIGSGFFSPFGVAVDSSGHVFVADTSNSRIVKMNADGSSQTTIASGFTPIGVAVDSLGHVFVADTSNNRIVEMNADGSNQTTIASGLDSPQGVAVDSSGHIFVADFYNNRIVEMNADGTNQTNIGSGFYNPSGVAVDGSGQVFVADYGHNRIVEMNADGSNQTNIGSGFYIPSGVAVDSSGHVFVADSGNSRIVKLSFGIADTTLPDATHGVAYAPVQLQTVLPGTSTSPYATTFKWGKGTLPPPNTTGTGVPTPTTALPKGMKLSKDGVLSGTPSMKLLPGTYDVIVAVTETVSTINAAGHRIKTKTTVNATIPITIN